MSVSGENTRGYIELNGRMVMPEADVQYGMLIDPSTNREVHGGTISIPCNYDPRNLMNRRGLRLVMPRTHITKDFLIDGKSVEILIQEEAENGYLNFDVVSGVISVL